MYSRAIFSSLLRVSGMAASSASSEQQRAYFSKSFPICEGISVDLHCIVMNFFDSTLFQRERRVSLEVFPAWTEQPISEGGRGAARNAHPSRRSPKGAKTRKERLKPGTPLPTQQREHSR